MRGDSETVVMQIIKVGLDVYFFIVRNKDTKGESKIEKMGRG